MDSLKKVLDENDDRSRNEISGLTLKKNVYR